MTGVFFGERLNAPGQGTALVVGDLGGCPDIRDDGIYLNGQRVIRLGLQGNVGVGDVGDLLAYRQMWEPFIAANLELWREMNGTLEAMPFASKCPSGLFKESQISTNVTTLEHLLCIYLSWSRAYTSNTDPLGILTQWNAWVGKTSAEMVIGADEMLSWHQGVVLDVGGVYADRLMRIAETLKLSITLPDVPEFSFQQQLRATIESAYIKTKGILQIIGYGATGTLKEIGSAAEAVAEGVSEAGAAVKEGVVETSKKLPEALPTQWTWIGVTAVLAVVGGGLIIYYVPRRREQATAT